MAKEYMYGGIVILVFCVLLYYSRTKFPNAAISTVPMQVVAFWLFIYFPFFGIIPSS
jgi:hypothetical protein